MKTLLIGNGAREHCIAESLAETTDVFAFMKAKNPGISRLAKGSKLGALDDFHSMLEFAKEVGPEFVVVGPENPLADGIKDVLEPEGFRVVGPDKGLARLESDKGFCRKILDKYSIPGSPRFRECSTYEEAVEAIDELQDVVIKASGLAGGKGVKVLGQQLKDLDEAKAYAKEVLDCKVGLIAKVVVEERLEGEEFSLHGFVDGKHVVPMPLAQDHKHAYEGDTGPMTGGMGSYSDSDHLLPFVSERERDAALSIMNETVRALKKETSKEYVGFLYGGFMITDEGPKLLEYNVRLGDPEAMNMLPIMENSLEEVCIQMLEGNLGTVDFESKATVCKYAVPKGYPVNPVKNERIEVFPVDGVRTYYASVDQREDGLYMSSSRAVGFVGIADSIDEAEKSAQKAVSSVKGPIFYRSDVGTQALIQKRMEHVMRLRY